MARAPPYLSPICPGPQPDPNANRRCCEAFADVFPGSGSFPVAGRLLADENRIGYRHTWGSTGLYRPVALDETRLSGPVAWTGTGFSPGGHARWSGCSLSNEGPVTRYLRSGRA